MEKKLEFLQGITEDAFGLERGTLFTHSRKMEFALPRHIFCHMAHENGYGCRRLSAFTGRHHSAVISSFRQGEIMVKYEEKYREIYEKLSKLLENYE